MIVYKTTNLLNGKIYIGVDSKNDPNYLGSGNLIKAAIKKYGKNNFRKEVLHTFETPEEAFAKEMEIVNEDFIKRDDTYNLRIGGWGGYPMSDSTKKILSKLKTGTVLSKKVKEKIGKGVKESEKYQKARYSPEYQAKQRVATLGKKVPKRSQPGELNGMFGRTHSKEAREKMSFPGESNPMYGKKHSKEAREKMGKRGPENSRAKKVYAYNKSGKLELEFSYLGEAAEYFNRTKGTIRHYIKKRNLINERYILSYELL